MRAGARPPCLAARNSQRRSNPLAARGRREDQGVFLSSWPGAGLGSLSRIPVRLGGPVLSQSPVSVTWSLGPRLACTDHCSGSSHATSCSKPAPPTSRPQKSSSSPLLRCRSNLDPFEHHTDETLRQVLERTFMRDVVGLGGCPGCPLPSARAPDTWPRLKSTSAGPAFGRLDPRAPRVRRTQPCLRLTNQSGNRHYVLGPCNGSAETPT